MHPPVTAVLDAARASWTTTHSLSAFAAYPDDLVAGNAAASPTRRLPKLSHGSPLKIKSQRRCIAPFSMLRQM